MLNNVGEVVGVTVVIENIEDFLPRQNFTDLMENLEVVAFEISVELFHLNGKRPVLTSELRRTTCGLTIPIV